MAIGGAGSSRRVSGAAHPPHRLPAWRGSGRGPAPVLRPKCPELWPQSLVPPPSVATPCVCVDAGGFSASALHPKGSLCNKGGGKPCTSLGGAAPAGRHLPCEVGPLARQSHRRETSGVGGGRGHPCQGTLSSTGKPLRSVLAAAPHWLPQEAVHPFAPRLWVPARGRPGLKPHPESGYPPPTCASGPRAKRGGCSHDAGQALAWTERV